MKKTGKLYIIATPIGNLQDITYRAVEQLKAVDLIAAEDTRHSRKLLSAWGISTPCISLHEHNEAERSQQIVEKLSIGQDIALISDAGTPLISDPGYRLVQYVREQGGNVVPIPGCCAVIAALCCSGMPTERFTFEGFLPAQSSARIKCLQQLVTETRTLVFYAAPHRLQAVLKDMSAVFGAERHLVIAKELTKMHETVVQMPLGESLLWVDAEAGREKGEFVLIIEGAPKSALQADEIEAKSTLKILMRDLPLKQAVQLGSEITGVAKNKLYELGLELKKEIK